MVADETGVCLLVQARLGKARQKPRIELRAWCAPDKMSAWDFKVLERRQAFSQHASLLSLLVYRK